MTFTLDDTTADRLRRAAARLAKPQSQVVREAIQQYADRLGKLGEEEQRRLLEIFDRVVPVIPPRPAREAEQELRAIRVARRQGGRRRPAS